MSSDAEKHGSPNNSSSIDPAATWQQLRQAVRDIDNHPGDAAGRDILVNSGTAVIEEPERGNTRTPKPSATAERNYGVQPVAVPSGWRIEFSPENTLHFAFNATFQHDIRECVLQAENFTGSQSPPLQRIAKLLVDYSHLCLLSNGKPFSHRSLGWLLYDAPNPIIKDWWSRAYPNAIFPPNNGYCTSLRKLFLILHYNELYLVTSNFSFNTHQKSLVSQMIMMHQDYSMSLQYLTKCANADIQSTLQSQLSKLPQPSAAAAFAYYTQVSQGKWRTLEMGQSDITSNLTYFYNREHAQTLVDLFDPRAGREKTSVSVIFPHLRFNAAGSSLLSVTECRRL